MKLNEKLPSLKGEVKAPVYPPPRHAKMGLQDYVFDTKNFNNPAKCDSSGFRRRFSTLLQRGFS